MNRQYNKIFIFLELDDGHLRGKLLFVCTINTQPRSVTYLKQYIKESSKIIWLIVQVQVGVRTRYETRGIKWTLGTTCASQDHFDVASDAFYKVECALVKGQTYTITCTSYSGEGWNSNLLIIENSAYCQTFTEGTEHTANITITGNWILLVLSTKVDLYQPRNVMNIFV